MKKIFIGKNLKSLRKNTDITLKNLSDNLNINLETLKGYESEQKTPTINNIVKINEYFNISIDFLLLWNECSYIRNIKLLSLAEKIDKMGQSERYQIESTAKSLLTNKKDIEIDTKLDTTGIDLKNNINDNIKIIFDNKEITQKRVANELNIRESVVSSYKTHIKPPAIKLIKLSKIFNISIHALATGKKLNYHFKNESLKEAILRADKFLSLEHQKFLNELMENIINEKKQP